MKLILLVLFAAVCASKAVEIPEGEDALTTPELISKYGYPVEVHNVTTADGYILELHRIPYGRAEGSGPAPDKPVVLLQHGLLTSSAAWVITGPTRGLGFLLADLGYDVWLGNSRGNTYSRRHVSLNPNSSKFWSFSWHEMGVLDLPATIDYMLERSGQTNLFYIGHDQGTTSFYVMASELPEYNSKIRAQFSLAPMAFMSHVMSPLWRLIAQFVDNLEILGKLIGTNEFLPSSALIAQIANGTCDSEVICNNIMFILFGCNKEQLDINLLPVISGHFPAGASIKQFLHYAQLIKSGKFRKYDYGVLNMVKYGSLTPPKYNLDNVTSPVALFYSQNDMVSTEQDVMKLYSQLPNPIGRFLVNDPLFSHLDFLWGKDVVELVYNKVFILMDRY